MSTHEPPTAARGERVWLLVARREVLVRLTDKSFIIGTLLTFGIVCGVLGFQIWSEQRTDQWTVAATPAAARTAQLLQREVPDIADAEIEVVEVDDEDAARAAVRSDDADVWLRPADDGWTLVADDEVPGGLERAATEVIGTAGLEANAEQAGVSVAELRQGTSVDTDLLDGDAEQQDFADMMGFVLAMLFYITTLGFGYVLAGSVVEEKASRVVEIIVTKIRVRDLLIGKIAGNTLLAIAQTALLTGIGLVGLSFTDYGSLLPQATQGVGWFVGFFLVGFCFIACWWAVAGALASRAEDLQSTATPLSLMMMAIFFASFALKGTWLVVASYVPPFSCVLMPIRVLRGEAAVWEPAAAIALLVLAMAATVVLAERLYRRALLQTQGRVGLRQAWSAAD